MARGHEDDGKRADDYQLKVMEPAGALHSSVNDLLKYVSANLALTPSALTPLMEKMQVLRHTDSPDMGHTGMPWYDQSVYVPAGSEFFGHGGGTAGSSAFVGFDRKQRRGVIVLTNQKNLHGPPIGWTILQGLPLSRESGMEMVREIVGLGVAFDLDPQTRAARVTKVYPGSPAALNRLANGDLIREIDGVPTAGKTVTECLALLRADGRPSVRLEIVGTTNHTTNLVTIARGKFLTSMR